jgi:hypothetical protein
MTLLQFLTSLKTPVTYLALMAAPSHSTVLPLTYKAMLNPTPSKSKPVDEGGTSDISVTS